MPNAQPRDLEASFRFIMRSTVCSEFRNDFMSNFDEAFDAYYARGAIPKEKRDALKKIMSDPESTNAMEIIYKQLYETGLKAKRCGASDPGKTPHAFWVSAGLAAGVVVLSGATLVLSRGAPDGSLLLGATALTLVIGLVQLFRSGLDKL